jgi:hypothetical protein
MIARRIKNHFIKCEVCGEWFIKEKFHVHSYIHFKEGKIKKMNKKGMLGQMISFFVLILIGVALLPEITKQVKFAQNATASNTTIASASVENTLSSSMLGLVPMFFAMAVLLIGFMMAFNSLRNAFGKDIKPEDEPEDEEESEETKPRKQTYYEYVRGRMRIEREMKGWFWFLKK